MLPCVSDVCRHPDRLLSLGLLCVVLALPGELAAQSTAPKRGPAWATFSVGAGSLSPGFGSQFALGADIGGGIVLPAGFRVGVHWLPQKTFAFMSDQSAYSARTLLVSASRSFVRDQAVLRVGYGRMVTRRDEFAAEARNRVVQLGGELWLPARAAPALRLFAFRTWSAGDATWTGQGGSGNPSQTLFGLGVIFH